jgi:hypothetical protein
MTDKAQPIRILHLFDIHFARPGVARPPGAYERGAPARAPLPGAPSSRQSDALGPEPAAQQAADLATSPPAWAYCPSLSQRQRWARRR